jgi:penicillin V acylase-like amidase (Ntn superfamily)
MSTRILRNDNGLAVTAGRTTGTVDGMNEHGLAAHRLFPGETDFGPRVTGELAPASAPY